MSVNNIKKYYSNKDLQNGIIINGEEVIPPLSDTTLRNARNKRILQYCRISRECRYTIEWLQNYIDRTTIECKKG